MLKTMLLAIQSYDNFLTVIPGNDLVISTTARPWEDADGNTYWACYDPDSPNESIILALNGDGGIVDAAKWTGSKYITGLAGSADKLYTAEGSQTGEALVTEKEQSDLSTTFASRFYDADATKDFTVIDVALDEANDDLWMLCKAWSATHSQYVTGYGVLDVTNPVSINPVYDVNSDYEDIVTHNAYAYMGGKQRIYRYGTGTDYYCNLFGGFTSAVAGVTVDSSGDAYSVVYDDGKTAFTVNKFDSALNSIQEIDVTFTGENKGFNRSTIAVDDVGNIYVFGANGSSFATGYAFKLSSTFDVMWAYRFSGGIRLDFGKVRLSATGDLLLPILIEVTTGVYENHFIRLYNQGGFVGTYENLTIEDFGAENVAVLTSAGPSRQTVSGSTPANSETFDDESNDFTDIPVSVTGETIYRVRG